MLDKSVPTSELMDNTVRGYLTQGQQGTGQLPPPPDNPTLSGYVKGAQALQEYRINEDKNKQNFANTAANVKETQMKARDFEHTQALQQGMSQAAQQGGFHAVIDYLQSADPAMAMNFMKAKTDLDKSMMENETYKLAHSNDKNLVMLQGYQMLGGLGATLMKARPEDREATYQSLLPIAKQIDPSISDKLDAGSIAKLGLGMSLSTPEAILYDNSKQMGKAQSDIGQTLDDYQRAVVAHGANSPEAQILLKNLGDKSSYQDRLQSQTNNTIASNTRNGENQLRGQWFTQSKNFNTINAAYNNVVGAKNFKSKDGISQGPNDMAIIYNYQKMLDPTSAVLPADYKSAKASGSWSDYVLAQYKTVTDGGMLSDPVRQAFLDSAQVLYENQKKSYELLKTNFRDVAERNKYNPDNVTVEQVNGVDPISNMQVPEAHIQYLHQHANDPQAIQDFQFKYGQDNLNRYLPSGA